ncbi:1-phosphofructokinase [Chloroflexota bacterium]
MIATVTLNPSLDKTVTVEGLVIDETNRWTSFRRDPGGKGINVSRVLHELGHDTIAYGLVGNGIDGVTFQQLMKQKGVPFDFTPIKGEIRSNFIITNVKTHRQTRIDAPGPYISEEELKSLMTKITDITPEPDFLVFAGSVPPGVPDDIYRYLIEDAKIRGIKTVLDSDGEWLEEGIQAKPSVIKPNVYEAEQLLGVKLRDEEALVKALKEFLNQGIEIAVISRGKEGLLMSDGNVTLKVIPPSVEVSSTVGAGDSAIAGLIMKLSQGASLEEAARMAAAAGTATALTPGTALCIKDDVEQILPKVKVEII